MKNIALMFAGAVLVLGGILLKVSDKYFEEKILPKMSNEKQHKYYEIEKELSEKGAYAIPFKDGKLISTKNTKHDRNNFMIVLGAACIIMFFLS